MSDGGEIASIPLHRAIEAIVTLLISHRLRVAVEKEFQADVERVLEKSGFAFTREYDLGIGIGTIDFYSPEHRIGLELKVKGSLADVARQLQRYAGSPQIDALVLVTGRARLGAVPKTIGGKPLAVASVWRSLL
jgi:hypothetical protein